MMNGRELCGKLNYIGMSKGVRKLAIDDKLAPIEEIALMSEEEICELVVQNYQLIYSEEEEVGLVKNEDAKEVFDKIKIISR